MNALKEFLSTVNNVEDFTLVKAKVSYCPSYREDSNIETSDMRELEHWLLGINYYNGYGAQELFGEIYLRDKQGNPVWLNRWEYDGAEKWNVNTIPDVYK